MPLVRNFADGEPYELLPGESALQLTSTADVPLYVGIRLGEFMLARPAADPLVTYVLTKEQYVRLQQQLKLQATYKNWVRDGLLVITDVTTPPDPPARERADNSLPTERPTEPPPWATTLPTRPDVDNTLPPEPPPPPDAERSDR